MNLNVRAKFIRVVLASAVGSVLWAGCATSNTVVVRDPAGAETPAMLETSPPTVAGIPVDQEAIAAAPIDQTKRRPDTHPELRSGLWQTIYQAGTIQSLPPVTETPVVELPEQPAGTVDSGHLLPYNPEVFNIALDNAAAEGIIVEAAGAQRPKRLWQKKTLRIEAPAPPPAPPFPPAVVEPLPEIEIQPLPQSSSPPPSPLKNEKEGGPLRKIFFVNAERQVR